MLTATANYLKVFDPESAAQMVKRRIKDSKPIGMEIGTGDLPDEFVSLWAVMDNRPDF